MAGGWVLGMRIICYLFVGSRWQIAFAMKHKMEILPKCAPRFLLFKLVQLAVILICPRNELHTFLPAGPR